MRNDNYFENLGEAVAKIKERLAAGDTEQDAFNYAMIMFDFASPANRNILLTWCQKAGLLLNLPVSQLTRVNQYLVWRYLDREETSFEINAIFGSRTEADAWIRAQPDPDRYHITVEILIKERE